MGVHSQKKQQTDDDDDDDEDLDAGAEDLDEDDDDGEAACLGPLPQSHKTKQTQISVTKEQKADDRYLLDFSRTSAMKPSLLAFPSLSLSTPQSFLHAAHSAFQV